MKIIRNDGVVHVTLSRRNLRALLAKLDGMPGNSACSIYKVTPAGTVAVTAEEDVDHYGDDVPGEMHDETEAAIR